MRSTPYDKSPVSGLLAYHLLKTNSKSNLVICIAPYYGKIGCVRFNVPFDTFLGHFGDGGVTAASARIIAAASAKASSPAQPHSVCGVE